MQGKKPNRKSVTHFFGFRGVMSRAGPGAGASIGNKSTHISIRPCKNDETQSRTVQITYLCKACLISYRKIYIEFCLHDLIAL